MAGTDSTRTARSGDGPAVVLVEPQLGENIGMVARAMLNFGLTDLRLVRPREAWPNDKALAASSGADVVIHSARLFDTTVVTPRDAAAELTASPASDGRDGILFGKEAKGLHNDDVALADTVIMAPLNPAFSSLNLAMAVLLVGYEWYQAKTADQPAARPPSMTMPKETRPARKEEMMGLFEHLEAELDACGFLRLAEKRPIMVRNLRNLLGRAQLTEQEVRTLRGVITCLVSRRTGGNLNG